MQRRMSMRRISTGSAALFAFSGSEFTRRFHNQIVFLRLKIFKNMILVPSRLFKRKMHSLKNAFALAPLCNLLPTGSLRSAVGGTTV